MKFFYKISFLLFLGFLLVLPVYAGTGAKLDFHQKNISLRVGDQQTVTVRLNPKNEKIIGVDLMMRFDPNYIKIIDVVNLGAIASQTGKIIDNNNGRIKYAVSNPYDTYLTKMSDIVNITLEAKQVVSKTFVTFDFITGKTYDTNAVIKGGEDVLISVDTLEVEIRFADNSNNSESSPGPTGSFSPNPSVTPLVLGAGNSENKLKSKVVPMPSDNIGGLETDENSGEGEVLGVSENQASPKPETGNWWDLFNKDYIWGLLFLIILIGIFLLIKFLRKRMEKNNQQTG